MVSARSSYSKSFAVARRFLLNRVSLLVLLSVLLLELFLGTGSLGAEISNEKLARNKLIKQIR